MATDTDAEAPHNHFDTILVLDFGSQTSHLILRRLRALSVYAEMLPCTAKLAELPWKPKGIVLSGGPSSVYDEGSPHVDPAVFELGVPILGIWKLLGKQTLRTLLVEQLENTATPTSPFKKSTAMLTVSSLVWVRPCMVTYMSHFDKLVHLPEGFVVVAKTANSEFAGIAHQTKPIFGVQFHPELEHTPRGSELLRNFSVDICGAQPNWVMSDFVEQEITRIRKLVGDKAQVIGAVSGGVDSTVAAKLMTEAIGDRFKAVHIDNGLMRLNESKKVKETLKEHLGINLTVIDGTELFLERLKGVTEPEKKRKIIGETFIDLFEKEAIRIEKEAENTPNAGKVSWFLQGTRMMDGQGLRLLEPLRELFKDEVRNLGRRLQIHEDLVNRFPFPGPGIAVRILGECTPERIEIARQADHIFISMIKEAGIYNEISQAYAGLDTSKAVGVMGDTRVYGYIIILRAVTTSDFMSAEPYEFPFSLLKAIARRIVNEVDGVSRVTYDLSSKPPGTIELE
ncbi:GMP synthase [glutamine-hydrolyzing] [Trichoderma asperellum]|uniref:GMP synthase [glutamine-hydrolyzing] n=1 Tax=Trichoderma asperellum TaxID=101201 RepID=A0A6V8QNF6_TRIAP|nr:GMP synthase [glutamine-hydrolyzing] [Trichoderma asperellum]